jgi:hypothetical protein
MILWAEGFDHYGDTETIMLDGAWAAVSIAALSTTKARTGSRSLYLSAGSTARRVFGGAKTTAGVALAVNFDNLPLVESNNTIMSFRDANNVPQVSLICDTTGIISVWRGNGGTGIDGTKLGDSTVPAITAAAWNHVEAKVTIHDSTGAVEVRVNGVTVINLTGIDTKASALTETSQVFFEKEGSGSGQFYIDDLVAWDTAGALNTDFIGDRKVFTDFPDADTADVEWTRSTGATNFGVIDENPPNDDTDYLTTDVPGEVFGVTFPDLATEVVDIAAVILVHRTRKTDAGTANVQLHLQSNGDVADGTDRPMTTAYTFYHDVFETDPDTAAPFTRAAASAIALQAERSA